MPKIDRLFTLSVSPEQFVAACDNIELQELELLIYPELKRRGIVSENPDSIPVDLVKFDELGSTSLVNPGSVQNEDDTSQ